MPTHAQQVRRRLAALGADVTDTSPRAGLRLVALLPAGLAWNYTGTHELQFSYEAGNRDAGFTAALGIIKQGTFECTAADCERCGRTAAPALPEFTFLLSGKAMTTIQQAHDLYDTPQTYRDETDDDFGAARRASAALQAAPRRQRGKGYQYAVTCDAEAAAVIADYCQSLGDRYATQTGPDDGAALLTAADRIRDAIRAHTPQTTDQTTDQAAA